MKHSEIKKLYYTVFDVAFAGDIERPRLYVHRTPLMQAYAWFNSFKNGKESEIFLASMMHDNALELVDTIVHELCHCVQSTNGEKLTHNRAFKDDMLARGQVVRNYFER